jgi:hypothetical protein
LLTVLLTRAICCHRYLNKGLHIHQRYINL